MTKTDETLSNLKDFLKRAGNSDETIESLINQIKGNPELVKEFKMSFKPMVTGMFSIKYQKNATEEEKNKLIIKAIEEHQTKQSLVS